MNKYTVYNRHGQIVDDAIVLRAQDTFTEGAIYAYLCQVTNAMQILIDHDIVPPFKLAEAQAWAEEQWGLAQKGKRKFPC